MSYKNKIKALRRNQREDKVAAGKAVPRERASTMPRDIAVAILVNPLNHQTSKRRKRTQRSLNSFVLREVTSAKDPAVKVTVRLRHLSLARVIRIMKKSAREASSFKHLLAKADPKSILVPKLEAAQTYHLGILRQATAEYKVRTSSKS